MIRLIWYGLVVGLASAYAQHEWARRGLEGIPQLDQARADAPYYVGLTTVGLALFSRLWRPGATFLLGALAGALATAPFAVARVIGQ